LTGLVRPSVGLSHMNYVEYLFNWTPQLDNTSLDQPVTKQCFMLFSVCVKRALALTQNTLKQVFINLTAVSVWRIFGNNMSSLLYVALLTYINEL